MPPCKWPIEQLTDAERACLAAMRKEDPVLTAPLNDHELALFALGRKLNVERALTLLRANNEWRKEFKVRGKRKKKKKEKWSSALLVQVEHMTKEQLGHVKSMLMSGVFQFVPFDKRADPGCSIIYLFPNSVPPEFVDVAHMMSCTWFILTRAAAAHVDNMRQVGREKKTKKKNPLSPFC